MFIQKLNLLHASSLLSMQGAFLEPSISLHLQHKNSNSFRKFPWKSFNSSFQYLYTLKMQTSHASTVCFALLLLCIEEMESWKNIPLMLLLFVTACTNSHEIVSQLSFLFKGKINSLFMILVASRTKLKLFHKKHLKTNWGYKEDFFSPKNLYLKIICWMELRKSFASKWKKMENGKQ